MRSSPPSEALAVVTAELPAGYLQQPYVWLAVAGAPASVQTPSASPFRFMAQGGTPPYRWAFGVEHAPPPGWWLDGEEGEIHGVWGQHGRFPFTIQVTDARGTMARAAFTLEVKDRVTRWLEARRIGGLIHGAHGCTPMHGDRAEQARQMARQGYAYAMQTTGWRIGWKDWPGKFNETRRLVDRG